MGESDRYIDNRNYSKRNPFFLGQRGNALMALFTLNVIFFLILLTAQVAYFFYQQNPLQFNNEVMQWFKMPASLTLLSERPWTIFTQMFTHTGVLEILSNMLWLWCFGFILQQIAGNKRLIPVYIYGGLAGALFFIIGNYSIPSLRPLLATTSLHTAGASTMAIAVAATTLVPNYKFLKNLNGGVSIWVLLLVYIIMDVARLASINAAFSLSHLGGAAAGYLYVYFLKRGKDSSVWMNDLYNWFANLFNPDKKKQRPTVKEKIFYQTGNRSPYSKTANVTQQRVDEILDKINSQGFNLLSEEEKNVLKRASEE
jgi:membrane associated rhomboid family serine protease